MSPSDTQLRTVARPRVGIPWRTSGEEEIAATVGLEGKTGRTEDYRKAVERAGGEAVFIPLRDEEARNQLVPTLDAFVLPGSPADVDPHEYESENTGQSAEADKQRENADKAVLRFAFAENKPVLAICYGFQMLNVYQRGSLIQDIAGELSKRPNAVPHGTTDFAAGAKGGDQCHDAVLSPGSILARLAGSPAVRINSRHHQAIDRPGENLRVTALSPDGIIEAAEWTGGPNWVVGVQWHPERLGDALSEKLFAEFVGAARIAHEAVAHKT